MSRNYSEEVVVLRVRPVGEIHASVRMLGRNSGIIDAMAYGARSKRGSLRGTVVPFASGTCYLYTDPVKKSTKITDLSVDCYYPELRENIKKYYVATLWAELVLSSYAAGSEGEEVWQLLSRGLTLLSDREEAESDPVNIQFLWRFLALLGMRPEVPRPDGRRQSYLVYEHRFVPDEHSRPERPGGGGTSQGGSGAEERGLTVSPGAIAYLAASDDRSLEGSLRLGLSRDQRRELKALLFRLIQDAAERELKTIRSGEGIL